MRQTDRQMDKLSMHYCKIYFKQYLAVIIPNTKANKAETSIKNCALTLGPKKQEKTLLGYWKNLFLQPSCRHSKQLNVDTHSR